MWPVRTSEKRILAKAVQPVIELLESRTCMTAVVPGWSETIGGCTISYPATLPNGATNANDGLPYLVVTGTSGDDLIRVSLNSDLRSIKLELNSQTEEFSLADLHYSVSSDNEVLSRPGMNLWLAGGDGNDTIVDALPGDVFGIEQLDGGAGNDTLVAGHGEEFDWRNPQLFTGPLFWSNARFDGGDGNNLLVNGGDNNVDDVECTIYKPEVMQTWWGPDGVSLHIFDTGGPELSPDEEAALMSSFVQSHPPTPGIAPVTLEGQTLVIQAPSTGAVEHICGSDDDSVLNASINGIYWSFPAADVKQYVFDERLGGTGSLNTSVGPAVPEGWIIQSGDSGNHGTYYSLNAGKLPPAVGADYGLAPAASPPTAPETVTPPAPGPDDQMPAELPAAPLKVVASPPPVVTPARSKADGETLEAVFVLAPAARFSDVAFNVSRLVDGVHSDASGFMGVLTNMADPLRTYVIELNTAR